MWGVNKKCASALALLLVMSFMLCACVPAEQSSVITDFTIGSTIISGLETASEMSEREAMVLSAGVNNNDAYSIET